MGDFSTFQLAEHFNCSRRTVSRILRKHSRTGSVEDLPRSGRPRKTSKIDDRFIRIAAKRNRKMTSRQITRELQEHKVSIAPSTTRTRLLEVHLRGCVAQKKPYLTNAHKRRRKAWAKAHSKWTSEDWSRVLWSDEAPFEIHSTRRRSYARRAPPEKLLTQCLQPTVKWGGGVRVMVWGCFGVRGCGPLIKVQSSLNAARYVELLQEAHLKPAFQRLCVGNPLFQQDNAPAHTASTTQEYLRSRRIHVIDWPAQSPDLNPIENVWEHIKQQLEEVRTEIRPRNDPIKYWELIEDCWKKVEISFLRKLIASMPKRCADVLKCNGGHIDYWCVSIYLWIYFQFNSSIYFKSSKTGEIFLGVGQYFLTGVYTTISFEESWSSHSANRLRCQTNSAFSACDVQVFSLP